MSYYPSNAELAEMVKSLNDARINNWLGEDVGSLRWWTLIVVLIVPWFIWYKFSNKKQFGELINFGLIVMVFSITLDELGFNLSWWYYPVDTLPIFPRLTSVDYTALPVVLMLIYQCFPTWKSFFCAMIITSAIFSFIIEPIIIQFGFYQIFQWSHWASFIGYIPLGLFSRWITKIIITIEKTNIQHP